MTYWTRERQEQELEKVLEVVRAAPWAIETTEIAKRTRTGPATAYSRCRRLAHLGLVQMFVGHNEAANGITFVRSR